LFVSEEGDLEIVIVSFNGKRRPSKLAMCCGSRGSATSGQKKKERAARLAGREESDTAVC
jgi:hypothetical protein